jgi:hypothetical protein
MPSQATLPKGREGNKNLHSHHKSNGSEQSSDYGRKKKEERKEEERQCIGDHPSHTWKCEGMEPFGRTHIICPSIFIFLMFSSFVTIFGLNSQV